MATVKKKDIANDVADQAGVSKTDAQTIVDTVLDSLVDSLRRGEGIELRGFGTFRFHKPASRQFFERYQWPALGEGHEHNYRRRTSPRS